MASSETQIFGRIISLMSLCWMPAEPGEVASRTFPHQDAVSAGLATWPCRQHFWLTRLFPSCAFTDDQQCPLSFL